MNGERSATEPASQRRFGDWLFAGPGVRKKRVFDVSNCSHIPRFAVVVYNAIISLKNDAGIPGLGFFRTGRKQIKPQQQRRGNPVGRDGII
ncbi:hypothetical protein GWI33_007452 [Rhynchophorus ferrugineus]|uniref:Uncharacterized protein n=1 Tax=Rhynchophorus ferrugineus TaxID=354439 RepID=A0A834MGM9_RHYFE|nr:hypothetical protein GWI33_007452 [Rhynchophorus ferrugineus]